jgi:hypothetical protein
MTHQPTIDPDGIPRCSSACKAFELRDEYLCLGQCLIDNARTGYGSGGAIASICLPALREKLAAGDALAKAVNVLLSECRGMISVLYPQDYYEQGEPQYVDEATQALAAWNQTNQTPKGT